jgi:hypothetical protein
MVASSSHQHPQHQCQSRASFNIIQIAACIEILSEYWITFHGLWLPLLYGETNELPTVGLVDVIIFNDASIPIFSTRLRCIAAWVHLISVLTLFIFSVLSQLLQKMKSAQTKSSCNSIRFSQILCWTTLISYAILASSNVVHAKPPLFHGIALICAAQYDDNTYDATRIVLAGTWMWSGIHKINPTFLSKPYDLMVDPLILGMFRLLGIVEETDKLLQPPWKIPMRLAVALTEATAGLICLQTARITKGTDGDARHLWKKMMTRVAVMFLFSMHTIIIVRLCQTRWNPHILGWNVSCLYLSIYVFWEPLSTRTLKQQPEPEPKATTRSIRLLYILLFVLLPSLVLVGMDPYLGWSLYSSNIPQLEMQLPAGNTATHLFQTWRLMGDHAYQQHDSLPPIIITNSHENGRPIIAMNDLFFHLHGTGAVNYPSVAVFKRRTMMICQQLNEHSISTDDAQFWITEHYTSLTLLQSLFQTLSMIVEEKEEEAQRIRPRIFYQQQCPDNNTWNTIQNNGNPNGISAVFSLGSSMMVTDEASSSLLPVELFWMDNKLTKGQKPTLVHQGTLNNRIPTVRITSHVGHIFVAMRKHNNTRDTDTSCNKEGDDNGNCCVLAVWSITRTLDLNKEQKFVLDNKMSQEENDHNVPIIPGLMPCHELQGGYDTEGSPEANDPEPYQHTGEEL